MSPITVHPVQSRGDLDRFIKLEWTLNSRYPNWVSPLVRDRRKILDRNHHPFYKDAEAELFIAEQDQRIVGRIAAILNRNHNREHAENIGFFGFFESIDDQQVADELLSAASGWLKARGAAAVRGPASPSVNYDYGLLVDGFDDPPAILMPYNPPYYPRLIERAGFSRVKDLFAYDLEQEKFKSEKLTRVVELLRGRQKLTLRPMTMKTFDEDLGLVMHLYRAAWQKNWGAVPMTDAEFHEMAADLKPIVRPELVIFALSGSETVGFSLSLPDYNQALRYNKRGGLIGAILCMLFFRKKINRVRILTLGVLPDRLKTGAGSLLFYETGTKANDLGYPRGEAGWVLEDNVMMNRAAEFMNARRSKIYRIYEKLL